MQKSQILVYTDTENYQAQVKSFEGCGTTPALAWNIEENQEQSQEPG
jgi:hypothetical protein